MPTEDQILARVGYRFSNPRGIVYRLLAAGVWRKDAEVKQPLTITEAVAIMMANQTLFGEADAERINQLVEEFLDNRVDRSTRATIALVEKLSDGTFRPTSVFYGQGLL